MGWRFELKHANTVAYVTLPVQRNPPRLTAWELREFLGSLQGEYRDRPPLISANNHWIEQIAWIARKGSEILESSGYENEEVLESDVIAGILASLRPVFAHYDFYGLTVGTWHDQGPLNAFAEHAAYSSGPHGLFLIPDYPDPANTLEIFDPLPVARKILTQPDTWPGVLFWLRSGESVFAPLKAAYALYQRMLQATNESGNRVARVLDEFVRESGSSNTKRILQLSDLHFGTSEALQNQAYLSAHLKTKLKSFERVVVTGDLFHNPKKSDALAFRNFRADIEATTGKDVIVIPGNHDQKLYGNTFLGFGRKLRELTKLEWSSLVVDDDLQCVFYCFDSSRDAPNFARGMITSEQTMELATMFETKLVSKPSLRDHLSIALIHHHPYSFHSATETPLQKKLAAVKLSEEKFLKMDGADEFLSWCVGRRIPLVLHGHKHVPRHVGDKREWKHGKESDWREVTAVGCGTSLGAEGMPLSYNVLEWSPSSRKWSPSFFSDPGSGTGFGEIYVALHSADA